VFPSPWFRKSAQAWFVQWKGRKVYLSRDRAKALAKWKKIIERDKAPSTLTVRAVLDLYHQWYSKNRPAETAENRGAVLKSFGVSVAKNLRAEDVRPPHVSDWVSPNARIDGALTQEGRRSVHQLRSSVATVLAWRYLASTVARTFLVGLLASARQIA
jgi:hypothetical protein